MINSDSAKDMMLFNGGNKLHNSIIQVHSSCSIRVPPDQFRLLVCVMSVKATCSDVKFSVQRRVEYISQTLNNHRVQDVVNLSHLERNENGFRLTNEFVINFTNLTKCLEIVNIFTEKLDGSVVIKGPEFYHSLTAVETARKQVCLQAGKMAREKALQLANLFSCNLGKLLSVSEEKCVEICNKKEEKEETTLIQSKIDSQSIVLQSEITAKFSLALPFDKMLTGFRWY